MTQTTAPRTPGRSAGPPTLEQRPPTLGQKLAAEFLGTFVLVFGGCGAAGASRRWRSASR